MCVGVCEEEGCVWVCVGKRDTCMCGCVREGGMCVGVCRKEGCVGVRVGRRDMYGHVQGGICVGEEGCVWVCAGRRDVCECV